MMSTPVALQHKKDPFPLELGNTLNLEAGFWRPGLFSLWKEEKVTGKDKDACS